MDETSPRRSPTEVHVGGWVIVQATRDLDAAGTAELASRVEALLTADSDVALDLRRVSLDPAAGAVLQGLCAAATRVGAHLVTVESDEQRRELLRGAGVPEVFESLDAALRVTTATLREAGSL